MGSGGWPWPPERQVHHAAVPQDHRRFDVWHTRTCGCPVRWITVRDALGGSLESGEVIEAVIVDADPHPDGTIVHLADGFGNDVRLTTTPDDVPLYRRHPVKCQREQPAPSPLEALHANIVAQDQQHADALVAVVEAAQQADPLSMFDTFIDAPPPPPEPTGLHAPPAGVEAHRAATEEAIERVERNSPDGWQDEAVAIIRDVASRHVQFTADDVWDAGLSVPPTPSALGPAFKAAQAAGFCVPTNMVQPSRYAQRHRSLKVWESRLVTMPGTVAPVSPAGFAVVPCGSCRAPITWTVTTNGAKMPVDALGVVDGNLLVRPDHDPNGTPVSSVASPDLPRWPGVLSIETLRTVSHFATCPNAKSHRRR